MTLLASRLYLGDFEHLAARSRFELCRFEDCRQRSDKGVAANNWRVTDLSSALVNRKKLTLNGLLDEGPEIVDSLL